MNLSLESRRVAGSTSLPVHSVARFGAASQLMLVVRVVNVCVVFNSGCVGLLKRGGWGATPVLAGKVWSVARRIQLLQAS